MRLDIEGSDLFFGLLATRSRADTAKSAQRIADRWSPDGRALAMLSVRSGFDALLQALALPSGSEVLVSAVTIRDMVRILEAHDLVAIPVDLDMRRLTVRVEDLERRRTPQTRAILIAHLFGSRMDLSPIAEFASRHDLMLLEDCAQSYFGDGYLGHPGADVSLFSFGVIKTATALGGALLHFRDSNLRTKVRKIEHTWPVQSSPSFIRRLLRVAVLRGLSTPVTYSAFVRVCTLLGRSHDRVISDSARGFPGDCLLKQIRRRPFAAQLDLLERRLAQPVDRRVETRAAAAEELFALLPNVSRCGDLAEVHTHWVLPILHDQADALIAHLWRRGFDATRGASSLYVIPAPQGRPELNPKEAREAFERLLYLPFDPLAPKEVRQRLAEAVIAFGGSSSQRVTST